MYHALTTAVVVAPSMAVLVVDLGITTIIKVRTLISKLLYQLIKACSERGKAGGVGSLCLLHLRERSICGHLSVLKLTHLLVGDPNLLCQALHMLVHLAIKVVNDAFSAWGLRHGVLISWLP